MLDLKITHDNPQRISDALIEGFKADLLDMLNSSPEDRFVEKRWSITKLLQDNIAQMFYDGKVLLTITTENGTMLIKAETEELPRFDDIFFAIRHTANKFNFAIYSNSHDGAKIPYYSSLYLDHTFFTSSGPYKEFFAKTKFIPRYVKVFLEETNTGEYSSVMYPPYFAQNSEDGSIHIINDAMLGFLLSKENQTINEEFSYKVAESMNEFGRKYDYGIIPSSFYANYNVTPKIVNKTAFDIHNINRKVFIYPIVWDFDSKTGLEHFRNVKNGTILMDKVRAGETLDDALKRLLREELKVASDYVGANVWDIEFDRDKEGALTPRLKIDVFVNGLKQKHASSDHDWVSIK